MAAVEVFQDEESVADARPHLRLVSVATIAAPRRSGRSLAQRRASRARMMQRRRRTLVALALCTFAMTHYTGLRFGGMGYLKHFAGEPLWLAPLMIPIHLAGELARPVSLTLRLMGNIGGEEKAVAIFISLGIATGLYLPLQIQIPTDIERP